MKLEYGMKLLIPVHPIEFNFWDLFGISSTSSKTIKTEFIIEKYWDSDTDANSFKVKCTPLDKSGRFGIETYYSSDLSILINKNQISICS